MKLVEISIHCHYSLSAGKKERTRNPLFPQMNTAIKAVIFFLMIMIPRIIVPLHANDDGISCCEKLYITTSKELSSPRLLGYYEKKANIVQGQVGSVSV